MIPSFADNVFLIFSGIHPTTISESFLKAAAKSRDILESMSTPLELSDRDSLLKSASTSLNSKVRKTSVDQHHGVHTLQRSLMCAPLDK